jgi:ribosome-binding factor A
MTSPRATSSSASRWSPSRPDGRRADEPKSQRTQRLDSQIQQDLKDLLQRELQDPRNAFATITHVETAADLGHARVWVSVYGSEEEKDRSIEALRAAAPWLRRQLGSRLRLRKVPQLSLRRDDSIEEGDRVLRILHDLETERDGTEGE